MRTAASEVALNRLQRGSILVNVKYTANDGNAEQTMAIHAITGDGEAIKTTAPNP
jgi:hypothetical protein